MKILHHVRREYLNKDLLPEKMRDDPIQQFADWFEEAQQVDDTEPNAVSLATYDKKAQRVRCRIVLLKEISKKGLIFFSSFDSRKGMELKGHPQAAITIYWPALHRQVRCEGTVKKISSRASDQYFATRPKESQIAALISPQSQVIPDRQWLQKKYDTLKNQTKFSRPGSWGGFELQVDYWEFWQGRSHRLHDRIEYLKKKSGWIKQRLAP